MDVAPLVSDLIRSAQDDTGIRASREDLLAAWWVYSQLSEESVADTRGALTSGKDGGIDAVYTDGSRRVVVLVQAKLRRSFAVNEKAGDLSKLTRWKALLEGPEPRFLAALRGLSTVSVSRIKAAREGFEQGLSLEFHFVSTGRATDNNIATHRDLVADESGLDRFRFVSGTDLLVLYDDYLAGVQPVHELVLPIGPKFVRGEEMNGVELGIYLVPGDAISREVRTHKHRLFARNIRGYQGDNNAVNREISNTVSTAPETFSYKNNGLTVVCDEWDVSERRHTLTLKHPQIVNGQQTSWTLAHVSLEDAARVNAIVKVVSIARGGDGSYDHLVDSIVKATNWQSRITMADLKSNDPQQIALGRALRSLGYFYARKKEHQGQTQQKARKLPVISRDDLADAIGGVDEESLPLRENKDYLFETQSTYNRIVDPSQASRDVACVGMWKVINARTKGPRGSTKPRTKWLVLYALWRRLGADFTAHSPAVGEACLSRNTSSNPLRPALNALVDSYVAEVECFFRAARGKAGLPEDATNFFKTPKLDPRMTSHLGSRQHIAKTRRLEAEVAKAQAALNASAP